MRCADRGGVGAAAGRSGPRRRPAAGAPSSDADGQCAGLRPARAALQRILGRGPDPDPWPRAVPGAQAGRRVRHRSLGLAQRQALHLLAVPRAAATRSPAARCCRARRGAPSNRAAALLRLAAVDGRAAPRRRWAPSTAACPARVGKAKAVTATARKIAVLFYNTLRHGMDYADPGASYYEERYRQRVLTNLRRRAKSLGYVLQVADPTAPVAEVS